MSVITKQACRDETVISVFSLSHYISRSTFTYRALYFGKIERQTSYIYIYIYIYVYVYIYVHNNGHKFIFTILLQQYKQLDIITIRKMVHQVRGKGK